MRQLLTLISSCTRSRHLLYVRVLRRVPRHAPAQTNRTRRHPRCWYAARICSLLDYAAFLHSADAVSVFSPAMPGLTGTVLTFGVEDSDDRKLIDGLLLFSESPSELPDFLSLSARKHQVSCRTSSRSRSSRHRCRRSRKSSACATPRVCRCLCRSPPCSTAPPGPRTASTSQTSARPVGGFSTFV